MTRHVSAERLARFREADLGRAAARRVAAHLAGCAACRAESDALAQLPGLLAGVSVPQLPAHLAARIENALATESAQRAATAAPAPSSSRPAAAAGHGDGRDRKRASGPGGERRARLPARARVLAAAAAVIVAGGLSFGLLRGVIGQAGGADSSGAAGSFPASAPTAPPRRAPAAGQEGPQVRTGPAAGPAQRYTVAGGSGTFTPVRSGTDYLPGQLARQAAATLAQVRAAAGPRPSFAPSASMPGVSARPGQLAGCVGRIAAGHSVLLVDVASYQGSPATVIITGPPGASQVWVAGSACSARSGDLLAHRPLS